MTNSSIVKYNEKFVLTTKDCDETELMRAFCENARARNGVELIIVAAHPFGIKFLAEKYARTVEKLFPKIKESSIKLLKPRGFYPHYYAFEFDIKFKAGLYEAKIIERSPKGIERFFKI